MLDIRNACNVYKGPLVLSKANLSSILIVALPTMVFDPFMYCPVVLSKPIISRWIDGLIA